MPEIGGGGGYVPRHSMQSKRVFMARTKEHSTRRLGRGWHRSTAGRPGWRSPSRSCMTGCLPHSPPLSPLPRGPESVTDRGHSLSQASLVTFHALHHYHHHHTVQNLSQIEDTVSVKHHWLPSSLSSTITSAMQSRICHRQRTQSQSSITGYHRHSLSLSPPPRSPGSVTDRGHSLSQASLVTFHALFHHHLCHAVSDVSQIDVKHHWLSSSLSPSAWSYISHTEQTPSLRCLPFPPPRSLVRQSADLKSSTWHWHWRKLPQVSFLLRQTFCRDKHVFDDHEQTDNTDLERSDNHEQTDGQTTDLQRNDDHEQSFLPVGQDMLDEGPASSDQQDRHKHQRSASPATGNRNGV